MPSSSSVNTKRLAEARSQLTSTPADAAAIATELLNSVDLDSPLARDVVVTLGEALSGCGDSASVLELSKLCQERWPKLASITYLAALAHGSLGQAQEMISALERCIALGEDSGEIRIPGAGTFLPLYRLGKFAGDAGDRRTARECLARALLAAPHFAPAREELDALDALAAKAPGLPSRLFYNDAVAMKACRHGMMTYPVNDAFIGRSLDLYGEWCEAELETLGTLVGPGATIVDVGANIGSHTVYFARLVGPEGRVIAFEPQSFAHGLLVANLATNGFFNTRCERAAVGKEPGKARIPRIDPTKRSNFGAVSVDQGPSHEAMDDVEVRTIDVLDLEACTLIKIDVEGMECDVLEGAKRTILRHKPVIFVENNTVQRSRTLLRMIASLGYRAYWHIAPYYRSDNHFANPENVFAPYQPEANLVCIPSDRTLPDMVDVVGDDDDFIQALTRAGALATKRVTGPSKATDAAPLAEVSPTAPAATVEVAPTQAAPAGPGSTAKGDTRPFTLVACIPGREFSGRFFDAWSAFADRCREVGIRLILSRQYDPVVYYARNKVLGGDVRRGPKQAPWAGTIDYDYMLWLDSDVIFRFEDFQALLARKVELVAGLYLMADNKRYAAVEQMNEEIFRTRGEFKFLTPEALGARNDLLPVDYCGFGFVLARRGVFERVNYPWFRPIYVELPGGMQEFTSEDVGFCLEAKRAGIQMYIDPTVVVGHEKYVVLRPPSRT